MASMTTSQFLRVYSSAKHKLNLSKQTKRIQQVRETNKRRRKMMQQNMERFGKKVKSEDKSNFQKLIKNLKDFKYHIMSLTELEKQLGTNLKKGLKEEEAEARLKQGENVFKQVQQTHWALIFLSQMSDPFSLFIWFIIILAFIGYPILNDSNQLLLAILLIVTIISGAIISYGFVRSSDQQIKDFRSMFPQFSHVIRDDQLKQVESRLLVPGDIVVFQPGDHIPADLRIIKSNGMKINKATFTGETQPVEIILDDDQKLHTLNEETIEDQQRIRSQNTDQHDNFLNPLQSSNMIFSGCINVEGEGVGVVIHTGDNMLIASIRDVINKYQSKESYLEKEIARFVKIITIFSLCVGLYTFFGGWIVGFPVVIAADIAIGVTCASCPGILNLELTCILYLATKKLVKYNMIAKNLVAVQSLGSTEILCTDKTGTLTTNKMTVANLLYDNKIFRATNVQNYPQNYRHEYNPKNATFELLHRCAVLSSIADFNKGLPKSSVTKITSRRDLIQSQKTLKLKQMEKDWEANYQKLKWSEKQVFGDSTESALIRFFQPIEDIRFTRSKYPITQNLKESRQNRILFNSLQKYSLSIHFDNEHDIQNTTVYLKGAPEKVIEMCSEVMINGEAVPKTPQFEHFYNQTIKKWGDQGKRMIGFCCLHLHRQKKDRIQRVLTPQKFIQQRDIRLKGMTFIGAVSIQDPPRRGIPDTILKIKRAGIKVIMITGDIQVTAVSIARQCNIFNDQKTTSEIMASEGISFKQALLKTDNVVVNNEQLMNLIESDEFLLENDKGKQLNKIIEKPNIIFTRANPSQKLYIVQSLHKLGFMVAVVGDGVNDSPSIKVANTGIAMGSGSDAARDASDIIIGDDDLNNIIIGIEEGRRVFDNFKKAICYVMTSQVSEWMPFIYLILSRVPIPIFTLLVDGAADFVPTLAFAYQQSQSCIMTRPPKFKEQNLVNFRLLAQCQGWMGFSSFLCCLFAYYIIMVDFGFVPSNLWGKSNDFILLENKWDSFNPTSKFFGNSNLQSITSCEQFDSKKVRVDWINTTYPNTDLRMSAVRCKTDPNGNVFFEQYYQFGPCKIQQISIYSFKPICYTPEATKYGQSSYMFANVINQIFNWIICRTRRDSAILKRFNNPMFVFGLGVQAMMGFSLAYSTPWIWMIGTRDIAFEHFGISAIPFALIQLTLDQIRKYLIRNLPPNKNGRPNWFVRNTLW